jgi:hypothetical protein
MAAMADHVRSPSSDPASRPAVVRPPSVGAGPSARLAGPTPAEAIALQRSAGNRAATRVLSRWAAHPDKDKKGVLMSDAAAGDYNRFNPPLSK